MLKTIDSIFSLNTRKFEDLEVKSSFIYNYYERNETTQEDNVITISDFSYRKKRFIRLNLENANESDRFDYNRDNFVDAIYQLSLKNSLQSQDIDFFNKIDKIIPKRRFLTNTLDEKEKQLISNFYKKDKNSSAINNIKYNHRVSYLNPEIFNNDLNRVNLKCDFPESGMYLNDSLYNDLIYKSEDPNILDFKENMSLNNNGCIFANLKKLESTVNEIRGYKNDYAIFNAIRCGLLIEKFVLKDEKFKFLCGKFITNNRDSSSLELPASIEDESVKYGETYKYVVYNVYMYAEIDPTDKCVLNKYLVCDHPSITKNIECVENEAPPPPINLKFRVIDDTKLEISWNEPTDYQYDAKGYQILKRNSLDEPFEIIAQLEGHLNTDFYNPTESVLQNLIEKTPGEIKYRYTDHSYQKGKITIYAIRTIDAHGYFSNYSEQIAVVYDPFAQKLIYDLVSHSGAERNRPNEKLLSKSIFFNYDDKIIDNLPINKNVKNISLYIAPDYCQVKSSPENYHDVFKNDEEFRFTIFRLNDLEKFEKQFKITNFIS